MRQEWFIKYLMITVLMNITGGNFLALTITVNSYHTAKRALKVTLVNSIRPKIMAEIILTRAQGKIVARNLIGWAN